MAWGLADQWLPMEFLFLQALWFLLILNCWKQIATWQKLTYTSRIEVSPLYTDPFDHVLYCPEARLNNPEKQLSPGSVCFVLHLHILVDSHKTSVKTDTEQGETHSNSQKYRHASIIQARIQQNGQKWKLRQDSESLAQIHLEPQSNSLLKAICQSFCLTWSPLRTLEWEDAHQWIHLVTSLLKLVEQSQMSHFGIKSQWVIFPSTLMSSHQI